MTSNRKKEGRIEEKEREKRKVTTQTKRPSQQNLTDRVPVSDMARMLKLHIGNLRL